MAAWSFPLVVIAWLLLSQVATAEVVHRFDGGWRVSANRAFTQAEVLTLAVRVPLKDICAERPEDVDPSVDCDTVGAMDFQVRVPDERLVRKLFESIRFTVDGSNEHQVLEAVLVDQSDNSAMREIAAPLVESSPGTFTLAYPDASGLLAWFSSRLNAVDAGQVAIERIRGLASDGDVTFSVGNREATTASDAR